jgi:DNA-binding transcriptional ArsR family regulator
MLRIWFAIEDLGRVRVARRPHALWETVLSLQTLQTRQRTLLSGWRDVALARLAAPRASAALGVLRPLVPARGYFPDFLTPAHGELADGIAAVLNTPSRRVAAELELLAGQGGARPADGGHPRLGHVGDALAHYHHTALAPYTPRMRALVDADRAVRARALLDGGVEGLLDTLRPALRWRRPLLEADYPVDQELRLDGRGLLLVPSVFCERTPITLLDPSLPPTLVYPIGDGGAAATREPAGDGLASLLGSTRGAVLRRLGDAGATTSELARMLDISAPSASQHASVLRRSGLVVSRRAGNTVVHHVTPLGAALLQGAGTPATGPAGRQTSR